METPILMSLLSVAAAGVSVAAELELSAVVVSLEPPQAVIPRTMVAASAVAVTFLKSLFMFFPPCFVFSFWVMSVTLLMTLLYAGCQKLAIEYSKINLLSCIILIVLSCCFLTFIRNIWLYYPIYLSLFPAFPRHFVTFYHFPAMFVAFLTLFIVQLYLYYNLY